MNLDEFLRKRQERLTAEEAPRLKCLGCKKAAVTCYCEYIRPFQPKVRFAILIHRDEAKRSVATGRMAHRCLSNSLLIEGNSFTHNPRVNALIQDPNNHCLVLYPGPKSIDLTNFDSEKHGALFPQDKQLVVFLIDATWGVAKRMRRLSTNLHSLQAIRFTPAVPSRFKVRKQPEAHCYSTIEAIHYLLEKLTPESKPVHSNLLEVFDAMVEKQLSYQTQSRALRGYRPRVSQKEQILLSALSSGS